jgi:hypothetical protein
MSDDITPNKLEQARAAREVATALSLYLSGKFHAPRLMVYGSVIRTALCRVDPDDSDGLPEVIADALLFGQCVESRLLGVALPDPAKFSAGVQTTLTRAMENADLWRPIIKSLTDVLLRDGRITGAHMTSIAECGNTGGGPMTGDRMGSGPGRRRLEDDELKPAALVARRRLEHKKLAG